MSKPQDSSAKTQGIQLACSELERALKAFEEESGNDREQEELRRIEEMKATLKVIKKQLEELS